jgi:superfamily I DNA/RNA helicase
LNHIEFKNHLKQQEIERAAIVKKILSSDAIRKVIVSGPGTGKTYTFKELLTPKRGNCLALTFINNLVNKLKKDLDGHAKTRTFHSFCKELLHNIPKTDLTNGFILFPKLETIITSDSAILYKNSPKFSVSFKEIDLSNSNIDFFLTRSSYYDAVSFDDSVYRVMEYFRNNPDHIPQYDQIVVDEYQDFNKLEVEFLNLLSKKSPILIVGDDDQALYGILKRASAKYIREKFNDPNYERFCLPFCSRCTLVVTQALEDIIAMAKKEGKLEERIDKQYLCYLPDKWEDSQKYPKIIHARCSTQSNNAPYIARYIEHEIDNLSGDEIKAANENGDFTVLVAGSGHYLKQIQDYFNKLNKYKLNFRQEESYHDTIKIVDGYLILLRKGESSNLGWRILLEADHLQNMKDIIKRTEDDSTIKLCKILPNAYIKKHLHVVKLLDNLKNLEELSTTDVSQLEEAIGMKIDDIKEILTSDIDGSEPDIEKNKEELSIVFTTYVGCKGLSAGFVFIIGLDEGSLPGKNKSPSDIEVCSFIVALTRTIKKCYLISTNYIFTGKKGNPSIFIQWIKKERIDFLWVDKSFLNKN